MNQTEARRGDDLLYRLSARAAAGGQQALWHCRGPARHEDQRSRWRTSSTTMCSSPSCCCSFSLVPRAHDEPLPRRREPSDDDVLHGPSGLYGANELFYRVANVLFNSRTNLNDMTIAASINAAPRLTALIIVFPPFVEEVLFRGLVFGCLKEKEPRRRLRHLLRALRVHARVDLRPLLVGLELSHPHAAIPRARPRLRVGVRPLRHALDVHPAPTRPSTRWLSGPSSDKGEYHAAHRTAIPPISPISLPPARSSSVPRALSRSFLGKRHRRGREERHRRAAKRRADLSARHRRRLRHRARRAAHRLSAPRDEQAPHRRRSGRHRHPRLPRRSARCHRVRFSPGYFLASDGAASGATLHLDGGKPLSVEPAGCPEGTSIIVRDLFTTRPRV